MAIPALGKVGLLGGNWRIVRIGLIAGWRVCAGGCLGLTMCLISGQKMIRCTMGMGRILGNLLGGYNLVIVCLSFHLRIYLFDFAHFLFIQLSYLSTDWKIIRLWMLT